MADKEIKEKEEEIESEEEVQLPETPTEPDAVPDFLAVVEDEPESEPEPEKPKPEGRFQKRIDQMRAAQGSLEQQLAQERNDKENLKKRLEDLESGVGQKDTEQLQAQYGQIRANLRQAVEEGDTDQQIQLTEALTDLRNKAHQMDQEKAAREIAPEIAPEPLSEQYVEQTPKEAMIWWNKNRWFNAPEFETESAQARAFDVQLTNEGYDKDSMKYYEELDNRLQKTFPELYPNDTKRSKPPTAPTKGSSLKRQGKTKDGRIIMTQRQLQIARDLGYSTKEEFEAYAVELAKEA